jgi:hypothetical protein
MMPRPACSELFNGCQLTPDELRPRPRAVAAVAAGSRNHGCRSAVAEFIPKNLFKFQVHVRAAGGLPVDNSDPGSFPSGPDRHERDRRTPGPGRPGPGPG